jgi:hypothetical protein
VGACSPTDFINEFTKLFFGMTCDHSLGVSQVFTRFHKLLLKKGGLPRVPDAPNMPKTDRVFSYMFAKLQKIERKQWKKMAKNTLEVPLVVSRKPKINLS